MQILLLFTSMLLGVATAHADSIHCVDSQTQQPALVISYKFQIPRITQTGIAIQGLLTDIQLGGKDLGESWISAKWTGLGVQYDAHLGQQAGTYFNLTAGRDESFQGYYQTSEGESLKMVLLNCEYGE